MCQKSYNANIIVDKLFPNDNSKCYKRDFIWVNVWYLLCSIVHLRDQYRWVAIASTIATSDISCNFNINHWNKYSVPPPQIKILKIKLPQKLDVNF